VRQAKPGQSCWKKGANHVNYLLAHVAKGATAGVTRDVEASCGKGVSRNASELDSASKRYFQVASLPKVVKPDTGSVLADDGAVGPGGVVGDGAR
jgi:hypothetical protein